MVFVIMLETIMAPGNSKKGQTTIPFNVSKAPASSLHNLPRRMSILDEPMLKKVGSMTSTSLSQGNFASMLCNYIILFCSY
ncbi:hypothetical protein LINPERHAP1_LOCUS3664 [Linum perenne]